MTYDVLRCHAMTSDTSSPADLFSPDICERHGIWLHIDAAWGGGLLMSSKYKASRFQGIER